MAEPARNLDEQPEEVPGNVDSPPPRHLESVEGGGETSPPEDDWYNPDDQPASGEQLQDRKTHV